MTKQAKVKKILSEIIGIYEDDILDDHKLVEDLEISNTQRTALFLEMGRMLDSEINQRDIFKCEQVCDLYSLV